MTNRTKVVKIYKNIVSDHDFFKYIFFKSVMNRKEPEPQFVILAWAPAPGGNLISAPRLRPWHHNTDYTDYLVKKGQIRIRRLGHNYLHHDIKPTRAFGFRLMRDVVIPSQ
jgi:hypothetical protein